MGSSRWDPGAWAGYASSTVGKSTAHIYTSTNLDPSLDPKGIKIRESRDSDANPNSTAIIVGLDVTGSMGILADKIAREGLGTLVHELLDRKPITDPHMMFMGIGDVECDTAPLQVTQFEADTTIIDQLTKIYLEHGGGGNSYESYILPWYFAAMKTSIDCFEKRGKKGYLFTLGDEYPTPRIGADRIERFLGDTPERDFTAADLLTMASRSYDVFHLVVEEGSHASHHKDTHQRWVDVLGQRAIRLTDYTKLAEVIVSAIQVNEGANVDSVIKSWKGGTDLVVANAVAGLVPTGAVAGGVIRL